MATQTQPEKEEINKILSSTESNAMTDFKTTSVTLLNKLLKYSITRLDSKVVNVLSLEGMMDTLMSYITRLDLNQEYINLNEISFEKRYEYSQHKRDMDLEATKKSYHAMELLSGTTANHLWLQNTKFYDIVNHLFQVFLPNSNGNLNHFFKIFQHLVLRHPSDMLDFVIIRDKGSLLFHTMLPYLDQSVVMESILSLLFVKDINPEIKEDREKSHERLFELGFLEWIIEAMECEEYPKFSSAAQEFFIRVIEEASQIDNGDILFRSLKSDKGIELVESLVKKVGNNSDLDSKERIIVIIKLLVKRGILKTRASTIYHPVQGSLYYVSLRVQDLLIEHIPYFCFMFIKNRKRIIKFTKFDLDILSIIYHILFNANEKVKMLASIPNTFWKTIVNLFFERKTLNIYHTLFYKLIHLTLSIHHEPTLIILVRKQTLITRLIKAYTDNTQKIEIRGFILLILNQLRLMADAEHSDLIKRIISSHPLYQSFLSTLKTHTLVQIKSSYIWNLDSCPKPPPYLGPSPPIQSTHFSPYSGTIPLMSNTFETEETSGIELGSDFAYSLGFKESPIEVFSRMNSDEEFPMDIIWS